VAKEKPAAVAVDPANMSVADMLAAARGESAAPTASEEPATEEAVAKEEPAAVATDPANMSVADMLAAARGESAAPTASEEPATEEAVAKEEPADVGGDEVQTLKDADDAAGMCAYCRKVDA
jgi:hypothetical protein